MFGICTFSQNNKNLRFIYIDHEVSTDVNYVCDKLKEARYQAEAYDKTEMLLIYLSTGLEVDNYALMSFTNIEKEDSEYETDDAFTKIIAALQNANSHTVLPQRDVENIISLFNKYPFFDSDGNLALKSMTMDFFVGKNFWLREYNQKIISVLNTTLNLYTQDLTKLTINIRSPKKAPIDYNPDQLFGARNLQGINSSKYIKIAIY